MLRKTLIAVAFVVLPACLINAQNAARYWHFGQHAKIHFATSGPMATTVTTINTSEGCSSISDSNGNLLFYTDGQTVWDANDNPMPPNGTVLNGNSSSTHSALIVPCDCNRYFIFTTDAAENKYQKGLQYSVVNTVSGTGYGIISKNNPLLPNPGDPLSLASEKVAGVSDGSGGFWVLGHKMGDDSFLAYHVVPNSGCTLGPPQVSNVGLPYKGGSAGYGQGQMKFSPDGRHLAVADLGYPPYPSYLELFDFNLGNGKVSNPGGTVAQETSSDGFYGVEFALDSDTLYATTTINHGNIYRYTTIGANRLGNRSPIANFGSATNNYTVCALQAAPDGKIYIARRNQSNLYVLPLPLTPNGGWTGTGPTFSLAPGSLSLIGLPTVVAGDFSCQSTPTPTATPKATATATATPTPTATPKSTPTPTPTPTPAGDCCDKISAVPYPQNNLQLDYRTFTITNLKAPVSPICSIDISLNPVTNPIWQGGDLYLDGVYQTPGLKFGSPYTRIPNRPTNTVTISAVNTIKFNLGVDYTIGWSGTATFVVHHCDGSTCTLTYGPWVAQPPATVPGGKVFDVTVTQEGKLFRFDLRLKARDWKSPARWISFRVGDGKGDIFAASTAVPTDSRDGSAMGASVADGGLGKSFVLYDLPPALKTGPYGPFSLVVTPGARAAPAPPIIWTVYDTDGNAFETGTVPGPSRK
jgi:hypothetical protein